MNVATTTQPTNNFGALSSATNFDLPSLHILKNEMNVALRDAESHLSEFNDDEEQAPLLLDSVDVMQQLAQILDLLALDGGSDLTQAIADCLLKLYDNGDNTDNDLIMDISEAIMTLDRYVEFVLLKETLEPALLIDILNKLNVQLNRPTVDATGLENRSFTSISISNPEQNYQSLDILELDSQKLSHAYRAGLAVVLSAQSSQLSNEEQQLIAGMQAACEIISSRSDTLFWQAANAVVTDIAQILPLGNVEKRSLIFVEQQFHNYLAINDRRFADLVSFACQRKHAQGQKIKQQFSANRLDSNQLAEMRRFLFGPNSEVTHTLNDLLQSQISQIKENVDSYARGDSGEPTEQEVANIATELRTLSSCFNLLDLVDAAKALENEANLVDKWQAPSPTDFDQLLASLIIAENASIYLAKLRTPGVVNVSLSNSSISLHQLDTAFETLVVESRTNIANVEQAISEYIDDPSHNAHHLAHLPSLLRQVAGSIRFLNLHDAGNMLSRLAIYIETQVATGGVSYNEKTLANIADVIMAVDYHLEGFENKHPVGKQAMNIGHHCLNELLAA